MKRRGNRRYYQHHEVLLVRRIRELLYEQGFTISGARNRLGEAAQNGRRKEAAAAASGVTEPLPGDPIDAATGVDAENGLAAVRADLLAALHLLQPDPPHRR
jgi:DNA-binding transcriptional MerR regulator